MRPRRAALLLLTPLLLAADPGPLAPPVRLTAAGQPINVSQGHAAPFVGDLLGDGTPQLLVGQFGEGKLHVFRNAGSKAAPRYDASTFFTGRVPTG